VRGAVAALRQGKAVQVDPIKLKLKATGTVRLKLKYDNLLSNYAFKFNLRRSAKAIYRMVGRCRFTPGCPRVDRAWFQRLKLKSDEAL